MRMARLGKKHSPETIAKKKLFRHTEEAKRKIKENNPKFWLGKKRPNLFDARALQRLRDVNLGAVRTPEQRRLLSEQRIGEKGSNWQGGKTDMNEFARRSVEYRLWREAVFARDNWTCQDCGLRGCELNADHIKPFALFPELRYAIDNGRTLCVPCHRKTPTYGRNLTFDTIPS